MSFYGKLTLPNKNIKFILTKNDKKYILNAKDLFDIIRIIYIYNIYYKKQIVYLDEFDYEIAPNIKMKFEPVINREIFYNSTPYNPGIYSYYSKLDLHHRRIRYKDKPNNYKFLLEQETIRRIRDIIF